MNQLRVWPSFFLPIIIVASACGSDPAAAGGGTGGAGGSAGAGGTGAGGFGGSGAGCAVLKQPVQLATGQAQPGGLAVDGVNVFWTTMSGGEVLRVARDGGIPAHLASGQTKPVGVAIAANLVYWTNAVGGTGSLNSVPATGGPATALVTHLNEPSRLVLTGATAYWISPMDAAIRSAPISGGPVNTVASGESHPIDIATAPDGVFWTDAGTSCVPIPLHGCLPGGGSGNGAVHHVASLGSAVLTVATGGKPAGIAADATSVYWADGQSGSIMRADHDGGHATTLVSGQPAPQFVATDSDSVFWTAGGSTGFDGTVMRVSKTGGPAVPIAVGQTAPGAIAIDDCYVYWTSTGTQANAYNDGAVLKASK